MSILILQNNKQQQKVWEIRRMERRWYLKQSHDETWTCTMLKKREAKYAIEYT